MTDDVEYRAIPGFPKYRVSASGVIVNRKSAVLRPHDEGGYAKIFVSNAEAVSKHVGVHRLVAMAWLGIPDDAACLHVAHHDGDKSNNHFTNLRWCRPAENESDKLRHGTYYRSRGHCAKITYAIAEQMRQLNATGIGVKRLSRRFGISTTSVRRAVHHETWRQS